MSAIVALPAPYRIKEGGLYTMPAEAYLGDPCPDASLNATTAKVIIRRSLRHAREQHPRLNPDWQANHADHFDIGSAAHKLFTGEGRDIVIVPFADWRTAEARALREAARALGQIPLLTHQYERVSVMYDRLPGASSSARGFASEVVAAALDDTIWLRTMIDKLASDHRLIIDYKTVSESAAPQGLDRLMVNFGWDVQAAFIDGVLDMVDPEAAGRREYVFLVQETDPPYVAVEAAMSNDAMTIGRKKVAYAVERWRNAMKSGMWPGYPDYAVLRCPPWAEQQWLARELEEQQ